MLLGAGAAARGGAATVMAASPAPPLPLPLLLRAAASASSRCFWYSTCHPPTCAAAPAEAAGCGGDRVAGATAAARAEGGEGRGG